MSETATAQCQTCATTFEEWGVIVDDARDSRTTYRSRRDAERVAAKWSAHGTPALIVRRRVSPWEHPED